MTLQERSARIDYLLERMNAANLVGNYEQGDAYAERVNRHKDILLKQMKEGV